MKKRTTIIAAVFAATALWAGMAHAIGTIRLPRTGQGQAGTCWNSAGTAVPCAGTGQDGEKQKGVPLPSPRFTDVGNGTVTDNLTGLIWLKNANCWGGTRDWNSALSISNGLASGQCGLSDGSTAGQWRLPNIQELESLVDLTKNNPALPAAYPFTGVQFGGCYPPQYWSSTTAPYNSPSHAYTIDFVNGAKTFGSVSYCSGGSYIMNKSDSGNFYTWPVR